MRRGSVGTYSCVGNENNVGDLRGVDDDEKRPKGVTEHGSKRRLLPLVHAVTCANPSSANQSHRTSRSFRSPPFGYRPARLFR